MKYLLFALTLIISTFFISCSSSTSNDTQMYKVSFSVSPPEIGTVSPTTLGTYEEGQLVTFEAKPVDLDYKFVNWSGDIESSSNPLEFTVDQNYSITANFIKIADNVTKVNIPPQGEVTLVQASNADKGVLFASTKEAAFGDGSQGIWLSENNGETWTKTSDSLVTFISIASKNPDLVLAGNDNGYLISTDGGHEWVAGTIDDPIFGEPISFNDASAVTENGIYVASSDVTAPGIYYSDDLGDSWNQVLSEDDTDDKQDAQIYHVYVSPDNENVIYAATSFNHNFWKSTNGGNSFTSIKSGISASSNFVFFSGFNVNQANSDHLFVRKNISNDGGQTWMQKENISPESTLWIDGELVRIKDESIFASSDFGSNWTEIIKLKGDNFSFYGAPDKIFVSKNKLYFISDKNNFSIYSIDLSLVKEKLSSL